MKWTILVGWMLVAASQLAAQDNSSNASAENPEHAVVIDDNTIERNFMPFELMYYKDTTNALSFSQEHQEVIQGDDENHPIKCTEQEVLVKRVNDKTIH